MGNTMPVLVERLQLENVQDFGEESKPEWFDDHENTFVFACTRCDWGGTKPISVRFTGDNLENFVLMYCPVCGLEVYPALIS